MHHASPNIDPTIRPGGPQGHAGTEKQLTILLGCYGDFPQYSLRAMDSIGAGRDLRRYCDVLVGLNECGPRTKSRARALADQGLADAIVESRRNLNKDPMMRLLLEIARTPYVVWLDDDSYFTSDAWPAALDRFVTAHDPFDVAGRLARWGPHPDLDPLYMEYARARPWWRGASEAAPGARDWVPFVLGGLFVVRRRFLLAHDYPDRGMIKSMDDVALGEMVRQVGGRMIGLGPDLLAMIAINQGHRRGTHFDLTDGWIRPGSCRR